MNRSFLVHACALLVVFALVGCGGGSGGGPEEQQEDQQDDVQPSAFQGPYGIYALLGTSGPEEVATRTGSGAADGQDTLSLTTTENFHGSVSAGGAETTGYTLTSDGAVLFNAPNALRGGVNADGLGFVAATTASGEAPGILLGLRKEGTGFSTASLSGSYHCVSFQQFLVDNSAIVFFSNATFDGAGSANGAPLLANQDAFFPAAVPVDYTYIVDDAGVFTDSFNLRGHVLPGNEIVVAAGATSDMGDPTLALYIRQQTAASAALFSGSYWAVRFSQAGLFNAFRTQTGTVTADGVGAGTVDGTRNDDGTISEAGESPISFSVQPSGRVDATFAGTGLFGAISADGRFAVFAGGTSLGQPGEIWVLVRKN